MTKRFKDKSCFTNSLLPAPRGHAEGMVQFEDIVVHNRNIGAPNPLITDATIIRAWN